MLASLKTAHATGDKSNAYAPHVMRANQNLTKIEGFDTTDQTDGTFYLITAWGRYTQLAGDDGVAMTTEFYPLLRSYALHYLAPGAKSFGRPPIGGNVTYWNETLLLLWNPNLEHSRLGSYWSAYDALTNAFAAEGLRCLSEAAGRLGVRAAHAAADDGDRSSVGRYAEDAAMWDELRRRVLHGLGTSLSFRAQGLRHHVGPHLTSVSALHHLPRAVRYALLGNHADGMLIGACDPML